MTIDLGRLRLRNPILVASGTFGYAREMERIVDLARLGGIVPKTITEAPRQGNRPWRTVETASGMLNSIGLDNDGVDAFLEHHLPYLAGLGTSLIVSIAGKDHDQFARLCGRLSKSAGISALELNVSCPNVSGGVDYGSDAELCCRLVAQCRSACDLPLLTKLSPNVTRIAELAQAAESGGADSVSLINTCLAMAVDWKNRCSRLGTPMGGLSGPAIKPIALRAVYQAARAVSIPVVGIGGIASIDDVMEFLVAGASAVQLGTVNFYDPVASLRILDTLPSAVASLGFSRVADVVGSLRADT